MMKRYAVFGGIQPKGGFRDWKATCDTKGKAINILDIEVQDRWLWGHVLDTITWYIVAERCRILDMPKKEKPGRLAAERPDALR